MTTPLAAPLSGVPLDGDQQKAANHLYGNAAVAAAAGSGKTTLLVGRAIALVEGGADPRSILTLAFNTNAAATLRQRLAAHPVTAGHEDAMASTFHAFGLQTCMLVMPGIRVLPTNAEDAARRGEQGVPMPTARDLGREVWTAMGGDLRGTSRPPLLRGIELEDLLKLEPGARERLFAAGWPSIANKPAELLAALRALHLRDCSDEMVQALAAFMPLFRNAKTQRRAVDFADMLLGLGHFIRKGEPQVMARLTAIKHLQVDEAQDGNELRWFIALAVSKLGGERSVMAVGDLRQSIAGFAGAEPRLFREWWDASNTTQFTLPRNYRSASAIVNAGNVVAEGEPWNVGGDAIAARADLGVGSVRVAPVGTLPIAVEIASAIANGEVTHKGVTVLARTRAALETIAFGLRTKGLKVFVRGGGFVWKGMDGRMVRAYLDLAERKVRDPKAAVMALNRPLRYVSGAKLATWITNEALNPQLYREANSYRPAAAVTGAVEELASGGWAERVDLVESWLLEGLRADREENAEAPGDTSDKADLIRNLCAIARVCGSVANLDIAIEAETKIDPKAADVVELSTIHQSKGDQWDRVYVTGVEEGVFPHARALDPEAFAEEVRLLYVAVTRPVHMLVVDVGERVERFAAKIRALQGAQTSGKPTPPSTPPPPSRKAETQAETVEAKPAKVTGASMSPAGFIAKVEQDEARAQVLTEAGTQPRAGERFVPVRWEELETLLVPHGFVEDEVRSDRAGQRVLNARLTDGSQVLVYTSVPGGADVARGNGDDSMKVALLDGSGKPMARKQPYAARTRNWRVTLLHRITDAMQAHPVTKGDVR